MEQEALGDDIESFQKIPAYFECMVKADPSTYYYLEAKVVPLISFLLHQGWQLKHSNIAASSLHWMVHFGRTNGR
jgi:hypothetical protein